jgi:hypothetical protein
MTQGLVGHWALAEDVMGSPHSPRITAGEGCRFASGSEGRSGLSFTSSSTLRVDVDWRETTEFSWSMWADIPPSAVSDLGSLMSCYDPPTRVGAELGLLDSHSTTSRTNVAGVEFAVDWGSSPRWTSMGRPAFSTGVLALAVHDGSLYAGTLGADGLGRVCRWDGQWSELPGVTHANCISALASHRGYLYAGSTRYRAGGSALDLPDNDTPGGEISRLEPDGSWTSVGRLPGVDAITGLAVHSGRLYAAAMYQEGIWVLEDDEWRSCGSPGRRVLTLGIHAGRLHAGGNDHADPDSAIELTRQGVVVAQRHREGGGGVFAMNPDRSWEDLGYQPATTQVYSLATSRDKLLASTWPNGTVYEYDGEVWTSTGRLGMETEVMGLITYNGALYGGTLPHAQLYRRDPGAWTAVGTTDVTPGARYRRAAGLAVYRGSLAVGTLPSGFVHRMDVGDAVTHDHTLRPGWHHLAATCDSGSVTLWVDGRMTRATRRAGHAACPLPDRPTFIGSGSRSHFAGILSDVRIYDRALRADEILALTTARAPRVVAGLPGGPSGATA